MPTVQWGHSLPQGAAQDKQDNTNKGVQHGAWHSIISACVLSGHILLGGLNLGDSSAGELECQTSASGRCVSLPSGSFLPLLCFRLKPRWPLASYWKTTFCLRSAPVTSSPCTCSLKHHRVDYSRTQTLELKTQMQILASIQGCDGGRLTASWSVRRH